MKKAIDGNLPLSLRNLLTIENSFFYFKNPRIKQTEKSLLFAGPKLWYNLPDEYIQELNFSKFKTHYREYSLNK